MKTIIPVLAVSLLMTGCAALVPDSIRPELEHMSHATQHQPFTNHPTDFDGELASVFAHWDIHGAYLEVGEGVILNRLSAKNSQGETAYGEIEGPREQFTARVGYVFELKHK